MDVILLVNRRIPWYFAGISSKNNRSVYMGSRCSAAAATVGVMPRFFLCIPTTDDQGMCWSDISSNLWPWSCVLGRNSAISFLLGLLTFNSYSYLIRKNFWPPRVFPVHSMKADNAPFVRKGLPEVTISWDELPSFLTTELTLPVTRQLEWCIDCFLINY